MKRLPPWFMEAWVLVFLGPRQGRRKLTYWSRRAYERAIDDCKYKGRTPLYGIYVKRKPQ